MSESGNQEKSSSMFKWKSTTQFMRALASDINEFVETLSSENSDILNDVRTGSKSVVTHVEGMISPDLIDGIRAKSMKVVDQVQDVLSHGPAIDTIWQSLSQSSPSSSVQCNEKGLSAGAGIDEHIAWIQDNRSTYSTDPSDSDADPTVSERFRLFQDKFTLTDDDKAAMLAASTTLEGFYHELVPGEISDFDFWTRYLFLIGEAKEAATRRLHLLGHPGLDPELSWAADNDNEEKSGEERDDGMADQDGAGSEDNWDNWS